MKTGKEMAIDVFAEIEMRQSKMKSTRKLHTSKIALAVAAMICILCTSVFAVYHFTVPKQFEEDFGTKFTNIQPVLSDKASAENSQIVSDSVETDGCTIRFEAIADAEAIRHIKTMSAKGETIETNVTDKFALFSIKSSDSTPLDEKYDFKKNPVGYCVGVPGYSPNGTMFEYRIGDYYDSETNTLIVACLINEAEIFADKDPYIVLFSGSMLASPDFIRMDEEGQPYFTENHSGIGAIFTLPLDTSLADRKMQKTLLESRAFISKPDYSVSDKYLALDEEFRQSGTDLSAFIGDNEWLGRYPLQFGKVEFSDIYLQHRNDLKTEKHRLLTIDELDKIVEKSNDKIHEEFGISDEAYNNKTKEEQIDYDIMIKEKVDSAVYCGGLPEDAEYFTLPDGSKTYYCYGFIFLHIGNDGKISTVIVPNHKTVVEIFGLDSVLEASFIADLYSDNNTSGKISNLTEFGWLIDNGGIDWNDPIICENNRDWIEGSYSSDTAGLDEHDAEFETISHWQWFPGTVQVIAE